MADLVREPIYQQVVNALRGMMDDGSIAVGEQFLTEREIAARFQVSRATANKALSALVAEGRLDFRKGVGTFVRAAELGYDLRALVSFTAKARAAGKQPSTRVLRFERVQAATIPDEAAGALGLEAGREAFAITRLRLADDHPVIYEERYVVADRCPALTREEVAGSIYTAWTDSHGLVIGGAEQQIRAENLDPELATALAVDPGSAALAIVATGHTADGEALWWEHTRYRADAYAFTTRIGDSAPPSGMLSL